jgi:hypothetical protein
MKTLIFPDLHEPPASTLSTIERLIGSEAPDRVVFLGDYFDHYYDTLADAARCAQWLKTSLADPRRTHLIGNHDASYLWANEATFCPGFTWEKEKAIRRILRKKAADSFVFHTWVDGWLLTHAGLSAQWVSVEAGIVDQWLITEDQAARGAFAAGKDHWYVAVGLKRGGTARAGGILWCDHRELEPIPGIRQIYGHTPADRVRIWKDHICLDTNTGRGPRHYAAVEDGKVEIRTHT